MATQFHSKSHAENIAIIGAGGNVGKFIAEALVRDGKHKVTAITRPDSSSVMPEGLHDTKRVLYEDHSGLVKALEGQDVLIITMGVMAPPDSQKQLINAAAEAGVKWIMPNEWGTNHANKSLGKDTMLGDRLAATREHIEKVGNGQMFWIGTCCGFWYEFSLAGSEARYGFDFNKKELTLYDDGNTKINTTTWPQVGRAVASLLSTEDLTQYNNTTIYFSSFLIGQRDMLASVLRVTGDSESDWKVSHEDVKERYQRGVKMFQGGDWVGFGILLYARVFFKDGGGDFSDKLDNGKLGLPEEDLDEATKVAVGRANSEFSVRG